MMIFVTVGTDASFDRLMKVVDAWAGRTNRKDVFAQIGKGGWVPQNFESKEFLKPEEFKKKIQEASVVIAHAGMGTILTALNFGKPVLVMPKRASLGEHRTEHQTATAQHLAKLGNIHTAMDDDELAQQLDRIDQLESKTTLNPYASPELIKGIRQFIFSPPRP